VLHNYYYITYPRGENIIKNYDRCPKNVIKIPVVSLNIINYATIAISVVVNILLL